MARLPFVGGKFVWQSLARIRTAVICLISHRWLTDKCDSQLDRTMASDGEDHASSPESESSPLEYNRPVTADFFFRLSGLPSKETLCRMWNLTENDRMSPLLCPNGTTANEILARTKYDIRGRIIECSANGGNGATRGSTQTRPYLARNFLIKLWRLKRESTSTKNNNDP